MTIQEQVEEAYKTAFRAGKKDEVAVLRMLKSSMKNEEIEHRVQTLNDDQSLAVLRREVKRRRDSITLYEQGGRQDLAAHEASEVEILQKFLPTELSDAELEALVQATIVEVGATSSADFGKLMGAVKPKIGGRADGGRVAACAKRLISQ